MYRSLRSNVVLQWTTDFLVGSLIAAVLFGGCTDRPSSDVPEKIRVATFNIEDLRTTDFLRSDHPRLRAAARIIQSLRPDILLVNEMAYDQPGVPGFDSVAGDGFNAERFLRYYLSEPQDSGLIALQYDALAFPSNTGIASGFDLDNDGRIVVKFPIPAESDQDGTPPRQTAEQRAYGNDSWGFGTFPGQYSFALFVSPRVKILHGKIRMFRRFRWSDLPGVSPPVDPDTGVPWYSKDEWAEMPLSSKNHVDVPVLLSNGAQLHLLLSHPTPPAFDGREMRNKKRNHDEIRFWMDYVDGKTYFRDNAGVAGGLSAGAEFVIMGDLNADPDEGSSWEDPVGALLSLPQVYGEFVPMADAAGREAFPDLDPDDTAEWGLRVDYVLPSAGLEILTGGVLRPIEAGERASDHFPVFIDIVVPPADPHREAPERATDSDR